MVNSLYIHIPFCRKKCFYCNFYSIKPDVEIVSAYIKALCRQINESSGKFSTVYVGGGTPTVLNLKLWQELLTSVEKKCGNIEEYTIEANPESFNARQAELFLDKGVNRLSLGFQSFNDVKLKKLGRIHSANQALEAFALARRSGFKNINVDLIFGTEAETLEDWEKELSLAIKISPEHISLYGLSYEKNTPLYSEFKESRITPLDEALVGRMYTYALGRLPRAGFLQYEVSNFAKKGFLCRHNMNYWRNGSYLGFGPSAVSYLNGRRMLNISDVKEYIKQLDNNRGVVIRQEKLSRIRRAKETAAIKIRTKEGIDFSWFKQATGIDFMNLESKAINELIEGGLIRYKRSGGAYKGVCLSRKGFLFCDSVSSSLL
ncbi:MAG: radical SAM family heme chaperone HemW [Candidatus Omnitrophica bacterium]|nr:radical SAM family heme chaperone HemW [Candidatus Omnitrophota bacterium]MDD5429997.1 radical SAM family heme chaperone HemW [Candidatus Omnitrophota bacterium]